MPLLGREIPARFPVQHPQKNSAANSSEQSSFSQALDVVVVDMVDQLSVVGRLIGRENVDHGAQSGALDRMVTENMGRPAEHGRSPSERHVVNIRNAESLH